MAGVGEVIRPSLHQRARDAAIRRKLSRLVKPLVEILFFVSSLQAKALIWCGMTAKDPHDYDLQILICLILAGGLGYMVYGLWNLMR